MFRKPVVAVLALLLVGTTALAVLGSSHTLSPIAGLTGPIPEGGMADGIAEVPDPVARGEYLVNIMGCHDCHTPWVMTEQGPGPDMSRMLSGHPEDLPITGGPELGGPWGWAGAASNTAFAGPWGVSFTANLTPDPDTGLLATWTADTFMTALRTGRHEGQGRPILPPMPWAVYRNATDADLEAIFAYLQSIPPVRNRVPQPLDPPMLVAQ